MIFQNGCSKDHILFQGSHLVPKKKMEKFLANASNVDMLTKEKWIDASNENMLSCKKYISAHNINRPMSQV